MRDRQIEQFEALFERASIPVLDIPELELTRLSAILKGSSLAESVLQVAAHLAGRHKVEVKLHYGSSAEGELSSRATQHGYQLEDSPFTDTSQLIEQISSFDPQLVIVPVPAETELQMIDINRLVEGIKPPILLIRQEIADGGQIFKQILHCLTGNFQQTENFSHSFRLVAEAGEVLLLHVINHEELDDVRDALQLTSEVDTAEQGQILAEMARHGERYLKGVVAAAGQLSCNVRYQLEVGNARSVVEAELSKCKYGLLVVGAHESGRSHVGAEVYQLMHLVTGCAVLAL